MEVAHRQFKHRRASEPEVEESSSAFRLTGYAGKTYTKLFWTIAFALVVYTAATMSKRSTELTLAGWASILCAGFPILLWIRGVVPGLPVFPLFAFCYLITYGVQFLLNADQKLNYLDASIIWGASFTFCLFILCATAAWVIVLKLPKKMPAHVRVFEPGRGDLLLLTSLAAGDLFFVCSNANWVPFSPGLFSIMRAFITGLSALAIFVIAFRSGAGQLAPRMTRLFGFLLFIYIVSSAATFFLVGAISALLMTSIGYTLGKNAVPWLLLGFMLVSSSILHFGKFEMRAKYWSEGGQSFSITPMQYPAIYAEWLQASLEALNANRGNKTQTASIYERSSLLDILLMVREMTPAKLPFLDGETYKLLPEIFMPRILNKSKISSHEADTILNIYYEKQSRESTNATTFGWGLLNESYANYGMLGAGMVGAVVGLLYGFMTRISLFQPLLSLPTLLSLTAISYAIQTESVSTYLVAALFQSIVAVTITGFVFMKKVSQQQAMDWQEV